MARTVKFPSLNDLYQTGSGPEFTYFDPVVWPDVEPTPDPKDEQLDYLFPQVPLPDSAFTNRAVRSRDRGGGGIGGPPGPSSPANTGRSSVGQTGQFGDFAVAPNTPSDITSAVAGVMGAAVPGLGLAIGVGIPGLQGHTGERGVISNDPDFAAMNAPVGSTAFGDLMSAMDASEEARDENKRDDAFSISTMDLVGRAIGSIAAAATKSSLAAPAAAALTDRVAEALGFGGTDPTGTSSAASSPGHPAGGVSTPGPGFSGPGPGHGGFSGPSGGGSGGGGGGGSSGVGAPSSPGGHPGGLSDVHGRGNEGIPGNTPGRGKDNDAGIGGGGSGGSRGDFGGFPGGGMSADTSGADSHGGGFGCFPADTMVLMADGTLKAIQKIRIDDKVMSFDGRGDLEEDRVIQLIRPGAKRLIRINGVRSTPKHRFFVYSNSTYQFLPAYKITYGDFLVRWNGDLEPVTVLDKITDEYEEVFNLTVERNHTYVANNYRVHNIKHQGGYIHEHRVPGVIGGDVPELLQEGEFVLSRDAVDMLGLDTLRRWQQAANGIAGRR